MLLLVLGEGNKFSYFLMLEKLSYYKCPLGNTIGESVCYELEI